MNRQAQAVILFLFGGAVLKASLGDLYLRYVKEGLRPFLIAAGLALVAAAVMTLWYEFRKPAASGAASSGADSAEGDGEHGGDEHADDHGHAHHEPRVGWLLILPVLGLLLVAPPALGSYTAGQSGTVQVSADSDYAPLPEGDPVRVSLLDYASRVIYDEGRSVTGRRLALTGFVTTGPEGVMLARIVVSCCAADGRPIKVGLDGGPVVDVPAGTWLEVTGRLSAKRGKDPVNQADIAYLEVEQWKPVAAPKQQYE
ncbi:TIGR03943 family putative permease subunit [Actinoplanes couchii]|uniref:Membrane protein n=1 Tax=Actinoplanes couchii TaxID=403638 RepID=A0ABQ3X7J4_9ACTN|nr:TIGR03943 family protein [Actinoplanes couchii]MDR6322304.1 putative repeat protein (TIGR03943 family) [Actinoplanes couchii]GID54463.1 membrane protein [Actinoplanes couchii]